MKALTTLVVDDELKIIDSICALLRDYCPEIEVAGTATSAFEAKSKIETLNPQLVFLDINMPKVNGFEFLESIVNRQFQVVFITAYDQYAIDALKIGALDYILKPIILDELKQAISKVQEYYAGKQLHGDSRLIQNKKYEDKILLRRKGGFYILPVSDIVRLEADGNYTKLSMADGKSYTSAKTLKTFIGVLNPEIFFRIHRTHLININYVKNYIMGAEGKFVEMRDGTNLKIAQHQEGAFRKFFGSFSA
ncbi:MAG: response regulator transcription factor [Bacteroidetes bacterium]|nr:response regulator transcription factor [Bacteroidota bacterium]